jgi:ABC-type oligopeptide transport system substrate-binding subunit
MRSKLLLLVGLVIMISMVMSACQPQVVTQIVEVEGETVVITVAPEGDDTKVLVTTNGGYGDIPTMDPQLSTDTASNTLLSEMYIGLTRLHETEAIVEPGMATDWSVSDDGLIYTFNLRTDIPWVRWDGENVVQVLDEEGYGRYVTAGDFEYGIKRECDPEIAADYAYVFYVIDGCAAFNGGELVHPDTGEAIEIMTLYLEDEADVTEESVGLDVRVNADGTYNELETGAYVEKIMVDADTGEAVEEGAEGVAAWLYTALNGGEIEDIAAYGGSPAGVPASSDAVAVNAIDDATLEVTFAQAAAYNTNIIGMWIGSATPQWIIEERGDRWPEPGFSQSYGPYALKEWVHDSYAVIVKNPFWPEGIANIPQPKIDEIVFLFLDEVPAFAEYESGGMDRSNVPLADLDRVKADPVLSEELFIGPQFCTYYYGFNTKAEHVDDVRVRQALSMAVDRQSLVDNVTKGGQEPAGWFSRPGLTGAPTVDSHPDMGIWYDPDAAKALFDEYLAEKGLAAEDLDLTLMFNTSSGHQAIAEAIQQMWKDTLGVEVKLTNQEWKVYLDTVRSADTPDVWRLGWCLDYPDANNFINEVFGAGGLGNPAKPDGVGGGINWYEGADYDAWYQLLLDAAVEADPAKRTDMYAEAEQILNVDKAAMIPLYWYTSVQVTKPYVERTYSVIGEQRFEKWDIDMMGK